MGVNLLKTILLVDNCKSERSELMKVLVGYGYAVCEAETLNQAVDKFKQEQPDLTIICLNPFGVGWEHISEGLPVARTIIEHDSSAKIIMTSYNGTHSNIIEAIQCGIKDLVVLPFYPQRLIEAVEKQVGS
jgi:two-component system chemotaxis response regulator CheY